MQSNQATDLRVVHDGVLLAGSLWTPGSASRSLVLMHPGSGPSDRHNDVLFGPIRAALLAAGHAVASFDKRGVGASTGTRREASIEQQAADMLACIAHLRDRHADVRIGVFGHSQGGWVVYEALGRADSADFGIANSGPGVAPALQERHALEQATNGHPDQLRALALFDDLVDLAARGIGLATVKTIVDIDSAGLLRGFASDLLDSDDEWNLASLILSYQPAPALGRIGVPLLAVFGADDPIVPVEASVHALRSGVDSELLSVVVFDAAGHRLETPNGTLFVDGYLDAVVRFANRFATN